MNTEKKIVECLLKKIVYGGYESGLLKSLGSPTIDWEKLRFILTYNELAAFLYVLLKNNPPVVPVSFFAFLKNYYYSGQFKYMALFQELIIIIKAANRQNILVVPLKGFSFTEKYYKRFGFRPSADIDLLVEEKDLGAAEELLKNIGYRKHLRGASEEYWRNSQCHLGFLKKTGNITVLTELHWALDCKRYEHEVIRGLWKRLKKINLEDKEVPVLSPEDSLFSLALHQRRFGRVFNAKYICDAGIILNNETLDWEYLLKTAFEEKIRASLYFLLYQVRFILDNNIDGYLDRLKIPFWQRKCIGKLVAKYAYSPPTEDILPYAFLLCHFLLYDDIRYPVKYVFNIPREQFAKFYSLDIASKTTLIIYKLRVIFIIYKLFRDSLRRLFKKAPF